MSVTIMSHEEARSCIELVAQDMKLQAELSESEGLAGTIGIKPPEDEGPGMLATSRLARIPIAEWGKLRVSKRSFLREFLWDFQDEGTFFQSCRTKIYWTQPMTDSVNLTDTECEPLLLALQACLYCYLPQNNYLGYCTSYNSVQPELTGFLKVGRSLYGKRILVDCNGNGQFVGATAITPNDVRECIDSEPTVSTKCSAGKAWVFWQKLSDAGNLPLQFTLNLGTVDLNYQKALDKERTDTQKSYMPISLEVLSEVVPHCRDLIEKYCDEIIGTYDLLHPLLCGDKQYREQKGMSWEKAFTTLKEQKSGLWKLEDFYMEKGAFGGDGIHVLRKTIRNHPDWPAYRKKNFPRVTKNMYDLSYGELVAIANDNAVEIPEEEVYPRWTLVDLISSHPSWADWREKNFPRPRSLASIPVDELRAIAKKIGVELHPGIEGPQQAKHIALRSAILNSPGWRQKRNKYLPKRYDLNAASNEDVLRTARDLGIDLEALFGGDHIFYHFQEMQFAFISIFNTFIDACFIIICLVTGMRRSELLHLEAGKAWRVPGTIDEYFLEFKVFKTDESSQGETVTIPIPEIAYKAYCALERITEKARQHKGCNYLSVNTTINFGEHMFMNVWNQRLLRFWERLGIEEHIHSHMFRKTLAMFAIYMDPRNLSIIKYLFSHKSLAMTLAYIVKIPALSEDIKLAIIEHNADLLAEALAAAANGKIGGSCGVKIKQQYQEGRFAARLHHEGRQSIREYVESLLEDGLRLLHRCPLKVICTNPNDSVISVNPEVCNCEVTNCDWAIFTESSIPDLEEEIRYHQEFIKNPVVSKDQILFSNRKIQDCLARYAEIEGEEAATNRFPECYGLAA
jgi:integrase